MDELAADAVKILFQKAGLTSANITWHVVRGGLNNQGYRVHSSTETFFLKRYFMGGDWDRLATESRFLRFCETTGLRRVPRLIAEDAERGVALHQWLDGTGLDRNQISVCDVEEAAHFLNELFLARQYGLHGLSPARDACLCLQDYLRSPRERIRELKYALSSPSNELETKACDFVHEMLDPVWCRLKSMVSSQYSEDELLLPFETDSLTASPSDFGFHNAMRLADNGLGFVDFEYSGVDDPVKAIGDFVCQPDFPPPSGSAELLLRRFEPFNPAGALAQRLENILPLLRVKFCCIILNDFKTRDWERRRFATSGNPSERRSRQLVKAQEYFSHYLSTF